MTSVASAWKSFLTSSLHISSAAWRAPSASETFSAGKGDSPRTVCKKETPMYLAVFGIKV